VTVEFGGRRCKRARTRSRCPITATGDLVSARCYASYLRELHAELVERIPAPVILHICGKTLDRMEHIAQTGVAAFHF